MPLSVRGYELYEIGKERWFHPEEIYELLMNYVELGYDLCPTRISYPQAGTFYLFHRLHVPDFKSDEIEWEKKKSSQTVHEQYLKLLIQGVHVITGQYATSSVDSCFRRRSYRLAEQQNSFIHLVHYRNCEGDAYVRKAKKAPSNKELPPLINNPQFQMHSQPQYFSSNPSPTGGFGVFPEDDQMEEGFDVDYEDLLLLVSQSSEEEKNTKHYEEENHQPQAPHISTIKILDFAPIVGAPTGGEKILLCLDQDIPSHFSDSQIQVIFSPTGIHNQNVPSMAAPAEILKPNVIRFCTPNLTSSHSRSQFLNHSADPFSFVLMVCTTQGFMISLPSGVEYTYQIPIPTQFSIDPLPKKRNPSSFEEPQLADTESYQRPSDPSQDTSRIHKIRIVEKFLTHNSLQGAFSSPISPSVNFESSDDDWLDDKSVSLLSSSDLEKLMDKYMFNVVNQLVQLAISDNDLKAELDHLDLSGYSLLHYCCLFNLTSLVDILLTKGANIHLRTADGSTALHLAADAGHYFIVQQLISAGADVNLLDYRGLTPAQSALEAGQPSLPSYWHLLSQSEFPSGYKSNPSSYFLNSSPKFKFGKNFSFDQAKLSPRQFSTQELLSEDEEQLTDSSAHFSSVKDPYFTPPVSRRPSSVGLDPDNALTPNMTLLQGAVSSLSLADKCALSLSLGNSGMKSPDDFEVQSVLSEYDKESLDVAMSMMGPIELGQVENEVRIIQNGVRTWLLRKNYINLRDAAKTLQVAWRGRKNDKSAPMSKSFRRIQQRELPTIDECIKVDNSARDSISEGMYRDSCDNHSIVTNTQNPTPIPHEQVAAAATLQAATRGMLARKEFHDIKRQAMASLVIQKSLLHWWEHKGSTPQSQTFHTHDSNSGSSSSLK